MFLLCPIDKISFFLEELPSFLLRYFCYRKKIGLLKDLFKKEENELSIGEYPIFDAIVLYLWVSTFLSIDSGKSFYVYDRLSIVDHFSTYICG